jgi:hypothetical protein
MVYIRKMCLCESDCIKKNDDKDEDEYDDENEANEPLSPIWWGSNVHATWRGTDPTFPDQNEITQD